MRQPPTNRITYPDRFVEAPNEEYLAAETSIPNLRELEVVGQ